MSTDSDFRHERINKLLDELRYEINRGVMESEISETMTYDFIVPISHELKDGVVHCSFTTRPVHRHSIAGRDIGAEPKLKLVE